jgi:hypothetical protein
LPTGMVAWISSATLWPPATWNNRFENSCK